MRNPQSPAWARYFGSGVALVAAAAALSQGAAAQVPCPLPEKPSEIADALTRANALRPTTDASAANQVVVGLPTASDQQPPTQDKPPVETDRRSEICRNIASAPKAVAVQAGITLATTTSFTGSIAGRLDSVNGQTAAVGTAPSTTAFGPGGPMGLGAGTKSRAPSPAPASPLTVYAMGTFLSGTRADAPTLFGFDYDSTSGTVGLEYSINRNLILGLAGNLTATSADINGGATVDVSTIQGAAYLSYATRHWFFDALAAYGSHDLDLVRPGVTDPVRGNTAASAFALAARAGYLFDFGSLRAGPIAGLTYVHSRIGGYTETGDPNLTLTVSPLTLDSLTGSVGIRFLASFRAGGNLFIPYLNVTLEHQFGDGEHALTASLASGPALPVAPFPAFAARDYGKIEGGVTVELGPELSASVSGASTFARDEAHDFRVSAGLNFRF